MAFRLPKIGDPERQRGQDVIVRQPVEVSAQMRAQIVKLLKELEQEPEDGEIPPPAT